MARTDFRRTRFLLVGVSALAMVGCSTNPLGNVFNRGGADAEDDIAPVAEAAATEDDDRIAVLEVGQNLEPDPAFSATFVSIPPAFANSEWSQPGGEADHVMHHLSGPDTFSNAWRVKMGTGGTMRAPLISPPVVANRQVFTVDAASMVRAFDTETGDALWGTALTPDMTEPNRPFWKLRRPSNPAEIGFGGGVAHDAGRLFVTSGFGFAAAMDAASGEVLWRTTFDAPVRNPPTAVNGRVFALTTANQVVALDQDTGDVVWTYESFEENARFLSTGSPAVDGDTVIVPFSSGEVVALDVSTGRLLWSATVARSSRLNALSNLNDIAGSPVIDRGGVFAISHSGQLSAIDSRTGRIAWEAPVAGLNMPWVAGDFLFVLSVNNALLCIDRASGGVVWRADLPAFENEKKKKKPVTWSGPLVVGERIIVVSSSGEMRQLAVEDGQTVNTYKLGAGTTVPPVVADGTVFILNNDARLEAWR